MHRFLLLALALLISLPATAAIYRHVDKDGKVYFTDQPPEDAAAEPVELSPINRLPAPKAGRPATTPGTPVTGSAPTYGQLLLTGVNDGQELRNPTNPVVVAAQPDVPLQPGHILVFFHNGQEVMRGTNRLYTVAQIDRGSHTFSCEIRNENDEVLIRSSPVTLHVHRTATPPARVSPR